MLPPTLDGSAVLQVGSPDICAESGDSCLVRGRALPVARRGPMPVVCPRYAMGHQNLRARSGSGPGDDPLSPGQVHFFVWVEAPD